MFEIQNVQPDLRHARVVPACVATLHREPLNTAGTAAIEVGQLFSWPPNEALDDTQRRQLRSALLLDLSDKRAALMRKRCGVRLTEGWRLHFNYDETRLIEGLPLRYESRLPSWTIQRLMASLGIGLESLVELLARLEALYWDSSIPWDWELRTEAKTRSKTFPAEPWALPLNASSDIALTDEDRMLAEKVLQIPWLEDVRPDDPRFGYPGVVGLPNWILLQLHRGAASPALTPVLKTVLAGDAMTASQEAVALIEVAAAACVQPGADSSSRAALLTQRYLYRGAQPSHASIGHGADISRSRVGQVCDELEDLFAATPAAAPALERVMREAAALSPTSAASVDQALAPIMGQDAGIESLVDWALAIAHPFVPVICSMVTNLDDADRSRKVMVHPADAPTWMASLTAVALNDCSVFGCTSLVRIAGRLALEGNAAPGLALLEKGLEALPTFRWLDKEKAWFTLGDSSNSPAALRIKKVVLVAQGSVGTDEFSAALATDELLLSRLTSRLAFAIPPVHVLRELLGGWPWLERVQQARFVPSLDFVAQGVLTDLDVAVIRTIEEYDGVATRAEMDATVCGTMQLSRQRLTDFLVASPIIERLEHGLYRLRGRRFTDDAVVAVGADRKLSHFLA